LSRPTSNRPLARSTSRQTIAPVADARPPPSISVAIAARRPVVWTAGRCVQVRPWGSLTSMAASPRSSLARRLEQERDLLGTVEVDRTRL
jgi:hypothetical protein